jgi:hypothetical protein
MSLIKYPETDYNSWVTEEEADAFFESRLHAEKWDSVNKEAALQTAINLPFSSICSLIPRQGRWWHPQSPEGWQTGQDQACCNRLP